jgi:UPF0271 protein
MKKQILFTADLGEHEPDISTGKLLVDEEIIPLIDMASIACGGHAGNAEIMQKAVLLAQTNKVAIGAHPGYPDKENFGRVSMKISAQDLKQSILEQIQSLKRVCTSQNAQLSYVKPHGALYNDSVNNQQIRQVLLEVVKEFELPLVTLAGPANMQMQEDAKIQGVEVLLEAFADRRYLDNGELSPRSTEGAVLVSQSDVIGQAEMIVSNQQVCSASDSLIPIVADCLCLHGDNPSSLLLVKELHNVLK